MLLYMQNYYTLKVLRCTSLNSPQILSHRGVFEREMFGDYVNDQSMFFAKAIIYQEKVKTDKLSIY